MAQFILQAAAIPVYNGMLCLISTRNKKRWIVPKGHINPEQSPAEAALQEAWEEAGLLGAVDAEPLGRYVYEKSASLFQVTVFLMHVHQEIEDFPESLSRQKIWLPFQDAVNRLHDPQLQKIAQGILFNNRNIVISKIPLAAPLYAS